MNFTPTDIAKSGYALNGWYTDSACTTAYTAKAWTAAGSLYAKYTARVAYDIYYAVDGYTTCYVYTFGNSDEHFGAWPGTAITSFTTGVSFLGLGALYKVTIPTTCASDHVIFNNGNGGGKQTANLKLNGATAFYWPDAATDSTGDLDKAYAAKVVYDINAARLAVTASSPILEKSYCGISKATATSLLAEYDALNTQAQAYMAYDNLTDYTYNYSDTTASVNVKFSAIIAQLRVIAASGSGTASIADTIHENNGLYITLGVLAAGLTAAGAMIFISKKRKHAGR